MKESLWINSSKGNEYKKLNKDIQTYYLIIGGGIVGITTAYLLTKNNLKVVLVDANKIGEGCTGRTTGKITSQHNIIYSKLKKKYNLDVAKAYYEANNKALDLIERIIKSNDINCDFERLTSYVFTEQASYLKDLQEEYEVCKKIGIDCEYNDNLDIPFNVKAAIGFNNQGQFNPKKYIDSLAKLITRQGGKIFENTAIVDIEKDEEYKLKDREGNVVTASNVIMACHVPWYDDLGLYFAKLKPERSYLVSGVINENTNVIPKAMYINVEEPGRSIRFYSNEGENFMLIGGESHKVGKGQEDKNYYEILKAVGKEKFNIDEFKYQWSAQDYRTTDNLPYIGYLNVKDENIYVGTGFAKWGMTNGTAAAMIISNLIINKESEFQEIFRMDRIGDILSFEMIKQNLQVGYEYIKGKIKSGSEDINLEIGQGKVVKINGEKYGAYKDEMGEIHIVDITCTHLGCELIFNNNEKSWDCPCHGSRFNYNGDILEGPATNTLRKYGDGDNNIDSHIL